MHNIKDLRKNLSIFKKKLINRNFVLETDKFKELDENNKKLINEKEKLEQEKGVISKSKNETNFEKSKKISQKILEISKKKINAQKKLNDLIQIIPNLAQDDVPIGKDENSNVEINILFPLNLSVDKIKGNVSVKDIDGQTNIVIMEKGEIRNRSS